MFGVQRQLVDLVRIKLLNSHRARLFYNAGYTTVASLAMCDLKKIEKILRSGVQFVGAKRENNPNNNNNKPSTEEMDYNNSEVVIWHDGQGYTYWQASSAILKEANDLLKVDLEQIGVKINLQQLGETTTAATTDSANDNKQEPTSNDNNKSVFKFNDDTVNTTTMVSSQRDVSIVQPVHVVVNEATHDPEPIATVEKISNLIIYQNN